MKRPSFAEPPDLWEKDGSLRDVYIFGASESDWQELVSVALRYPHRYLFNGIAIPVPSLSSIFANRDGSHLLTIEVGGADINCHFFIPTEIELDIDPRQVLTDATHEQILMFLESIARETCKKISLTAENSTESPLLIYEPVSDAWVVHQCQFQ